MPRLTKIYTRAGDDGTTALGLGQLTTRALDPARPDYSMAVVSVNVSFGIQSEPSKATTIGYDSRR